MSWIKVSDTAYSHPMVDAALELPGSDDRTVNELFGFVLRCASWSRNFLTDGVVTRGAALRYAGSDERAAVLIPAAIFAGYFEEVEHQGRPAYRLISDDTLIS